MPIALAESSAALALLLTTSAYVLDISYWPSAFYRRAAASTVGFFLAIAALCAAEKEPGLPIGLYIVGMPLLALGLGKFVLGPVGSARSPAEP